MRLGVKNVRNDDVGIEVDRGVWMYSGDRKYRRTRLEGGVLALEKPDDERISVGFTMRREAG